MWAPDGKHLLFGTATGTFRGLMWVRADGSTEPQFVTKSDNQNPIVPQCISPDGKLVVYVSPGNVPASGFNVWSLAMDNSDPEHPKAGERQPVGQQRMSSAAISRDGRWLAYTSGATGRPEIFVRRFSGGRFMSEGMWQISTGGALYPLWSKSGNQLLYLTIDGRLMVVDYTADGETFRPSKPRPWSDTRIGNFGASGTPLFNSGFRPYDLTPDGRSVITWKADQPADTKVNLHVTMLQNWFDELQRRVKK